MQRVAYSHRKTRHQGHGAASRRTAGNGDPHASQTLSDAAQRTLAARHKILERNAMEELDPLLSDKIVFRSPVAHTPIPAAPPSSWC